MDDRGYAYDPVGAGTPVNQQAHRMEEGQLWRQYLIAGAANLAIINTGYCMGWTAPINPKLEDNSTNSSPLETIPDKEELAWMGSLLSLSAIFGPFFGGLVASKIGRKWGLMSSSIPLFLGWILVAVATNMGFLYAGRILWGIAVGMIFTISPMYCAEIATDEVRGALGSFLQAFITVGFMLIYSIGPYVSFHVIAYLGIAFVAIFCVVFVFMPDTPTYYLLKNDREAAASSLCTLRGLSRSAVAAELDKIESNVKTSMEKTATMDISTLASKHVVTRKVLLCRYTLGRVVVVVIASGVAASFTIRKLMDIFRGSNFKAFYISVALVIFQQLSGINAVLFYLTDIFRDSGIDVDPAIATIIIGGVHMAASFVTPLVVDRLGRRILLLISSSGTAIGLILLGMFFLLSANGSEIVTSIGFVPILSLVLFIVTYSWGLGPLPWAVLSELLSVEIKAVASPIATALNWFVSFLATRFFEPIAIALGRYAALWIFAGFCIISFLFTMFLVPETKGKSFQEIQDMLAGKKSSKTDQTIELS